MARPLRVEFEGALYHVTARGNRREAIFANYADRECFLELLIRAFRQARSVAMWLVWQRCALSLREIGALWRDGLCGRRPTDPTLGSGSGHGKIIGKAAAMSKSLDATPCDPPKDQGIFGIPGR